METLSVAEAKRRFSELIDRVGRGERFVVARRGKPALGLVSPDDAARKPRPAPQGLLAGIGALADWPEFHEVMRQVVAARRKARDRPAPRFD